MNANVERVTDRIVIVFDKGAIVGAHVHEHQAVVVDGEIIAFSPPGDAEGLALETGGRWPTLLGDYLNEVGRNAIVQVMALKADIEALNKIIKEDLPAKFEADWKAREEELQQSMEARNLARKEAQKGRWAERMDSIAAALAKQTGAAVTPEQLKAAMLGVVQRGSVET